MKQRLALAALSGLALTGGASSAHAITTMSSGGSWGCAVIDAADTSVCLRDPLPEILPVPPVPETPPV